MYFLGEATEVLEAGKAGDETFIPTIFSSKKKNGWAGNCFPFLATTRCAFWVFIFIDTTFNNNNITAPAYIFFGGSKKTSFISQVKSFGNPGENLEAWKTTRRGFVFVLVLFFISFGKRLTSGRPSVRKYKKSLLERKKLLSESCRNKVEKGKWLQSFKIAGNPEYFEYFLRVMHMTQKSCLQVFSNLITN